MPSYRSCGPPAAQFRYLPALNRAWYSQWRGVPQYVHMPQDRCLALAHRRRP